MADGDVPNVVGTWKGTVVSNANPPYVVLFLDDTRTVGNLGQQSPMQVIDDVILTISFQSDPDVYYTDLIHRYGEATITGNIQYPGQRPSLIAGVIDSENNFGLVTGGGDNFNGSMSGQLNTAPEGHQGLNGVIRSILTFPDYADQIYYSTFSFGRYVAIPRDRVTDLQFPETLLP
jgi:hypothetical protein